MKLSHLTISILTVIFTSTTVYANTHQQPRITLDPTVVTATRTPNKTTDIIAQTTVINSETLKRYQGQTVLEVLRNQAGFHVTQNGGMGTAGNFYLRGYDNKSILVLIDGVQYKSITTGQPALNLLSANNIERIEVLHGSSGSSIYGSDAVGGVIQIFTKGASSNNFAAQDSSVNATVGYGSNHHSNIGLSGQYVNEKSSLNLGISHSKTDGIESTDETMSEHYSDNDGYEISSANLALFHKINDSVNTGLSVFYNESNTEFDSYPDSETQAVHTAANSDQKNGGANVFLELDNDFSITRLSYGQSLDESMTYSDGNNLTKGSKFSTQQKHSRLESRIKVGKNDGNNESIVTLGLENLQQKVDGTTNYTRDSRDINSGFVGLQLKRKYVDLQTNHRFDDNSQYGKQNTYNLGFAISPNDSVRIGANYSTGFRSPTFNDLYYPGSANPDLKPETSKNKEAFIELHNKLQKTRLTGYQNNVNDMIAYDNSSSKSINIGKVKVSGVNLASDWQLDRVLIGLGYDFQESEILSENNKGNTLRYQPQNKATAYLGYLGDNYDVRFERQYVGSRYIGDDNSSKVNSYDLFNVSGSYYFDSNIVAKLKLNNLADKKYQSIKGYNTEGRSYFASLSYEY